MTNIQNIAKGFLMLSFLVGVAVASPVQADNNNGSKGFLDARASLKADAMIKLENSLGVVMGPNGVLRVMGAKVTSVSGTDVNAVASFGNSTLSFVIKTDATTKLSGNNFAKTSTLSQLKAGDKISFAGTVTSSTSSGIVVNGDHVVSHASVAAKAKTDASIKGEVKTVNLTDNTLTVAIKGGATVKVAITSSTIVTIDGATKTLSSIAVGDEVKIEGAKNADATIVTATKIVVDNDSDDDDEDRDEARKTEKKDNKGGFWQRITSFFRQ